MYEQGRYKPLSLEDAIQTCHEMLLLFEEYRIPVIRMGLYPGEELCSEGVIVAGPFHPAFGERVEQSIFRQQAEMTMERFEGEFGKKRKVQLYLNPRDVSKMMGFKRANVLQIQSHMHLEELQIKTDLSLARNSIGISEIGHPLQLCLDRDTFIHLRKK
jgi:histone acetyltransferase (RNA polymerase elongator complex component)